MNRQTARLMIFPTTLFLIGFLWFTGLRPLLAELHAFRFKATLASLPSVPKQYHEAVLKQAEHWLLSALDYDPNNSLLHFDAFQFYAPLDAAIANTYLERAVWLQNGDLTDYAVWYTRGMTKQASGQMWEALYALNMAHYFYPPFMDVAQQRQRLDKLMEQFKPKGVK